MALPSIPLPASSRSSILTVIQAMEKVLDPSTSDIAKFLFLRHLQRWAPRCGLFFEFQKLVLSLAELHCHPITPTDGPPHAFTRPCTGPLLTAPTPRLALQTPA